MQGRKNCVAHPKCVCLKIKNGHKTVKNESYPFSGEDYQWGEWHPFHIHQNDFVVTEINGLSTDDITAYPSNQLADTVLLGGAYISGTATADNPYGQAAGTKGEGAEPFSTKIRMRFEDFPGAYVNHCHILFHEDAGMMQARTHRVPRKYP